MKQQLAIARALLHDPPLLLLDQPYTGLDREAAVVLRKILAVLRHRKRTVVMTTHHLERGAALANRVVMLVEGRMLDEVSSSDMDEVTLTARYERALGGH